MPVKQGTGPSIAAMVPLFELKILIDISKSLTSHLTLKDICPVAKQKISNLLCPQEEL